MLGGFGRTGWHTDERKQRFTQRQKERDYFENIARWEKSDSGRDQCCKTSLGGNLDSAKIKKFTKVSSGAWTCNNWKQSNIGKKIF